MPGGWNNNGFVGAGDGTAYILDGSSVYHVNSTAWPTKLPYFGVNPANVNGFVGAGDGTAYILENSSLYHLTPTGASSVPGGWANMGFVGAGDGTAYILDNTSVYHVNSTAWPTKLPYFGIDVGNNNGFVGAGDGTAFILDNTTMFHLTPTGATGLPGGWNNSGFVGAGFKIPEPSSAVLLGLALTGLVGWRKRS